MKTNDILTRPTVVAGLAVLCCFLWGSAIPVVKIGYDVFHITAEDTMAQLLFAGVRFVIAGCLTIFFGSLLERKVLRPQKASWRAIVILSLFQTVLQYIFYYVGMAHTSGVRGAIIVAANSFLSVLLACLFFHMETMTLRKAYGCLMGFGGVVLINLTGSGLSGGITALGEGFMLMSAVAAAISYILVKLYASIESPITLSGYQFLIGGMVLVLVALLGGGQLDLRFGPGLPLMLYLGMVSAVAYTLWAILMRYNPVSRVSIYGFTNPLFGVLLSAVLLHEFRQIPLVQALTALAMVCGALWIVNKE